MANSVGQYPDSGRADRVIQRRERHRRNQPQRHHRHPAPLAQPGVESVDGLMAHQPVELPAGGPNQCQRDQRTDRAGRHRQRDSEYRPEQQSGGQGERRTRKRQHGHHDVGAQEGQRKPRAHRRRPVPQLHRCRQPDQQRNRDQGDGQHSRQRPIDAWIPDARWRRSWSPAGAACRRFCRWAARSQRCSLRSDGEERVSGRSATAACCPMALPLNWLSLLTLTSRPDRRRSSRCRLSCSVPAAAGHPWQAPDNRTFTLSPSIDTNSIEPPCDSASAPIGPASSSAAIAASSAVSSAASTCQPSGSSSASHSARRTSSPQSRQL